MGYTYEERIAIFERTDGRCHLCFARLAFSNYGQLGARGEAHGDLRRRRP